MYVCASVVCVRQAAECASVLKLIEFLNQGWDKKNWTLAALDTDESSAWVTLTYISPDGEEGFPGERYICVSLLEHHGVSSWVRLRTFPCYL